MVKCLVEKEVPPMDHTSQQPTDNERAVARTMNSLESLASNDWDSACRHIIVPYSIASQGLDHDVCDSIDLWINNNGLPSGLVNDLTELISHEADNSLKHHYQEWIVSARSVDDENSDTA